jgi:hypothetical protein
MVSFMERMGGDTDRSATVNTSARKVYIIDWDTDVDPPINMNADPNHIVQMGNTSGNMTRHTQSISGKSYIRASGGVEERLTDEDLPYHRQGKADE